MSKNSVLVLTMSQSLHTDRLILTQDDDFFAQLDIGNTAGVLFQKDQRLSAREVGDIVHELSEYIDQSDVTLEYVSRNWL